MSDSEDYNSQSSEDEYDRSESESEESVEEESSVEFDSGLEESVEEDLFSEEEDFSSEEEEVPVPKKLAKKPVPKKKPIISSSSEEEEVPVAKKVAKNTKYVYLDPIPGETASLTKLREVTYNNLLKKGLSDAEASMYSRMAVNIKKGMIYSKEELKAYWNYVK